MREELTRRAMSARGAALLAAVATVPLTGDIGEGITVAEAASTTTQQTNATRAVAAYNAMQQYFYVNDGTSLYLESYPRTGTNKYSFLWPFTRALVGTLALAGVPSSLVGGTSYTPCSPGTRRIMAS